MLCLTPLAAFSEEKMGDIVFLKGTARIERAGQSINIALKTPVLQGDTITTQDDSMVKILCTDDSVLTINPQTKFSISEYLYMTQQQRSQSVFKLLFGKVRAVVGRAVMKVFTDTAVAGVRGTVFDIWVDSATHTTYVSVIEGKVELRNANPNIKGVLVITGGNMSSVSSGEPPKPVVPIPPQPGGTSGPAGGAGDSNLPNPVVPPAPHLLSGGQVITNNPPIHQMPPTSTKVGIHVVFP
jgi:hypothetical protein